jgi:hypothetical protein
MMTPVEVPFVADVRRRWEEVGRSLVAAGVASGFEITGADDGGVELIVCRAGDQVRARITMTGTTEVFLLHLGDDYERATTAYEDDDRWEAVDDFVAALTAFMWRDYYEEIDERRGRVVRRVLHLTVPGGEETFTGKSSMGDRLGRMLGHRARIVRPDAPDSK